MKNFYITLLFVLSFGFVSFANNISDKDFETVQVVLVEINVSPTACCSVGEFTSCGEATEPLCDRARGAYCAKHQCTKATLKSIGQE